MRGWLSLWRAAPGCFDEAWVGNPGHGITDALDADRVFPAVTEIVEVFERPGADILEDVDEPGLAGVKRSAAEVRIRNAPANIASTDLVEMAVRPANGSLQHKVQAIESDRQRHLDSAHDSRFDIIELDPQMGDAGGGHATKLRSSIGRGQCQGSSSSRRDAG